MGVRGRHRQVRRGDGVNIGVSGNLEFARHGVHKLRRFATGTWGLVPSFLLGQPTAARPVRDSTRSLVITRKTSCPHANSVIIPEGFANGEQDNNGGCDLICRREVPSAPHYT